MASRFKVPASNSIRIATLCLAGLTIGFTSAKVYRTAQAQPPTTPTPTPAASKTRARPWLRAWLAEQSSPLTSKEMPSAPPHLVPDTTDAQIARLAHKSVHAATSAIENITADDAERQKIAERLILDPLLHAAPVAALELARDWNDYDGLVERDTSTLFYDVTAGKYPDLATALLAEPPGPFRAFELHLFFEMWAKRDPATFADWVTENLPVDAPDTAALKAIATAALVRPGAIPPDLSTALAAAPPALRSRLYVNLFAAALDATDIAAHANALLALTPNSHLEESTLRFAVEWSHFDPKAAAGWSLSLPSPAAREAALAAIARFWPTSDPTSAATWLRTLPPLQSSIASPIFTRHLQPTPAVPE